MSNLIINPYTFAVSNPFLDTYTGSIGAYSVRKLDKDYTGYCMKVRRSSDNTEQDIGFTASGDFDETALTNFVGANSGYVTTWYDQSGTGNNFTQTTSSYQPRVVNSGTVDKINNKVAVRFVSSSSHRLFSSTLGGYLDGLSPSTFLGVVRVEDTISGFVIANITGSPYYSAAMNLMEFLAGNTAVFIRDDSGFNSNQRIVSASSYNAQTQYLIQSFFGGYSSPTVTSYRNSTQDVSGTFSAPGTATLAYGYLGASEIDSSVLFLLDGYIQEAIFYNSDKSSSRTGMATDINAYFSVY